MPHPCIQRARLVLAAALLSGLSCAAQASPLTEGSALTARADAGTLLFGSADAYAAAANPALAHLSSAFGDVEFLTEDGALFFDFDASGLLTLYGSPGASGRFSFSFDGLRGPLLEARPLDDIDGVTFQVTQGHTLTVTLHNAAFAEAWQPLAVQMRVPAPGGAALALLGLGLVVATRRRTR